MRIKYALNALGLMMILFGVVILTPMIMAIIDKDMASLLPFAAASIISILLGIIFKCSTKGYENFNDLRKPEALFIVAATWLFLGIIAGIPYLFYGLSPLNALFEAVSGITTTGSTILTDFSLYPKTFFLWRSMSQWLGGMGIIVLFIAILPQFAIAGRQMFFAEAPGPTEEKITPRIRHTASALWSVYIVLTIAEMLLLHHEGMPWFDSVCNSFSTIAAGGFSPHPLSIMGYENSNITWIVTVFMLLAGANFALQYKLFVQLKLTALFKSEEFRTYLKIIGVLSFIIGGFLFFQSHYDVIRNAQNALFQVISILTTTGFASVDFEMWPVFVKVFLVTAMMVGGCAGSAGGGVKVARILFGAKYLKREIAQIIHPKAVLPLKIDKHPLSHDVIRQTMAFLVFYFVLLIVSSILVSAIEGDMIIGLTGSFATIGNIGPGFGELGPMSSFDGLNSISKSIFILNMLVGRLELIPFLAMLHPDFWAIKR